MSYKRLEEYGLIGNMHSAALVGRDGAIDWLCLPRFDSPAIFSAILDDEKGGSFSITAPNATDRRQMYFPETNVLTTRFGGQESVAQITDFMPISENGDGTGTHRRPSGAAGNEVRLIRYVQGVMGETKIRLECRPRFNLGATSHTVEMSDSGVIFRAETGELLSLSLPCEYSIQGGGVVAEFTLAMGQAMTFSLELLTRDNARPKMLSAAQGEELFHDTVSFWRDWVSRCTYDGRWREDVIRSLLTLKLLTYSPTGAIIAAPTTSLPEQIGGTRNWDYRYCWIRDSALTLQAFMRMGYVEEARMFMRWLGDRCRDTTNAEHPLQIMYGISGEKELPEIELNHLDGYRGSKPVRVGNGAYKQLQLDMYGELLEAVFVYNRHAYPISFDLWRSLITILDWVAKNWRTPDEGIWEVRGGRRQFVHSKLMAWNALAKGLKLADERSLPASRELWITARDEILLEIMEKGWSHELQSFVQSYGSDVLDASLLQLLNIGALSPRDPRMMSTVAQIEQRLAHDSLVYRYDHSKSPDGLPGTEGTFTMCTFWLVEALTRMGRLDDARFLFERMLGYASPLGLYAEETGRTGELLGNFPQAFTHLSLINAAFILDRGLNHKR
jgi:GH15 family glucan-1,4-alpha-glucosidase